MDLALRIVTALGTLTIGIAASILAYQQYKISKAKLRFDLYEKRLALFKRALECVSLMANDSNDDGSVTLFQARDFYYDTIEREFLFGKDVSDYFLTIFSKMKEKGQTQLAISTADGELVEQAEKRLTNIVLELNTWFNRQQKEMFDVFKKDLSIKTLR